MTDAFEIARKRGLHPLVSNIRISRTDRLFASAQVASKNAAGHQLIETAAVALMQAGGRWLIVIGPGTDFASLCQGTAPQPILHVLCR